MFHETLFSLRGADMRVELDKKSLFALASDTRLDILRSLQPMRRTISQLSEALDIDKAAIHRHLKKMEEGGLVRRFEDHGFVYYGLSWKARDLLSPNENTRIIILLSASWILCLAVIFLVVLGMTSNGTGLWPAERSPIGSGNSYHEDATKEFTLAHAASWLIWIVPIAVLVASCALMVVLALRTHFKPKQRSSDKKPETTGQ